MSTLNFIQHALPLLYSHYQWFKRTQAGPEGAAAGSFRWRGATRDHSFASGLDDYPRGLFPTDMDESVDLLSWMIMAADMIGELAALAGNGTMAEELKEEGKVWRQRLVDRHWNEDAAAFCDIGVQREELVGGKGSGRVPITGHVCHQGYVTHLPLFLRLLEPESQYLSKLLDSLEDPGQLWSPYGLRSLSKQDPLFSSGEDYWRGAVWINLNYLAIGALQHYGGLATGPQAERAGRLAGQLQSAVVQNIVQQYSSSGFLWENYAGAGDGRGRGTHPFTGWTALVALMIADRHPI